MAPITDPMPKTKVLGVRHGQVAILCAGLTIAYTLRVNLSVAIVAMTDADLNFQRVNLTTTEKGSLSGMFFYGYTVAGIPAGILVNKLSPRYLLSLAGLLSGIITLVFPWIAVNYGFVAMSITRMILGLTQGLIVPGLSTVIAKWAVPTERGIIYSIVNSGSCLGTTIMMGTGGILAASPMGWPSIFYASGGISVLWVLLCFFMLCDSPSEHKSISQAERDYIVTRVASSVKSREMPIPWKSILLSGPVWAMFISGLANNWSYWTLLTLLPTYMKEVLSYDIEESGLLSSLPSLGNVVFSLFVFPWMAKCLLRSSLTLGAQRKLWNSVALYFGAICLATLSAVPTNATLAVTLLVMSVSADAATFNGFLCNGLDVSPNFTGVIMGLINGCSNLSSLLAPTLAGFILVDEGNVGDWQIIFIIAAIVNTIGNTAFLILGSAEVQPWNDPNISAKLKRDL